ncbi:MAG: hypothetical protein ACYTBS_07020, partial [Planctomycetota bacterium]
PTRIAHLDESATMDQYVEELPVAESIGHRVFEIPWFKHYDQKTIEQHANAYKKVIKYHKELLAGDTEDDVDTGGYSSFFSSRDNTR